MEKKDYQAAVEAGIVSVVVHDDAFVNYEEITHAAADIRMAERIDIPVELNPKVETVVIPLRLSVDKNNAWYDPICERLEVYLNGKKRPGDVQQYDMERGIIWTRVANGRGKWRVERGRYVMLRLTGNVEVRLKDGA